MERVYIAGKLNDDAVGYIKNVHNMIAWAEKVRKLGFAVFVPALDFLMGMQMGNYDYKDYFENSQPFLAVCNYVFVCPGYETSKGTKKEIEYAESLGIKICYSLEDLVPTKKTLENKIKTIISDQLGVKLEEVTPEASIVDDLGADSLDTVELVMALEEEFGIEICDEEAEKVENVKQVITLVKGKTKTNG